MARSSSRGKGQAAALDLAVFVSICILALAFMSVQSARSAGSTGFVEENENMNEVAVKALDALARSSGDLEIKTLQTAAFKKVDSCLSNDIRTIMSYADEVLELLNALEKEAMRGDSYDAGDSPFVIYLTKRVDSIMNYLLNIDSLAQKAEEELKSASKEAKMVCDALEKLSSLLPGYDDVALSCGSIAGDLLKGLTKSASAAIARLSDLKNILLNGLSSLTGKTGEELADAINGIRCDIKAIKGSANSALSYLETGIDPQVSFLELLPVDANLDKMTIEKMLSDAITAGDNFAYANEARSLAGAATLLLIRDEDLPEILPEVDPGGLTSSTSIMEDKEERIILMPKSPLSGRTNTSAEGPYNGMTFAPEAYLTPSGLLAVRLVVYGGDVGGVKHDTEYFERLDYILNSSAYPGSVHYRTYNGSFIQGKVTESPVTVTTREWTGDERTTPDINATVRFKEEKVLRPMEAGLSFAYENLTWPEASYGFDIEHYCLTKYSDYNIQTSARDCDKHNESDAEKAMILGALTAERGKLLDRTMAAVESRLRELLEGYEYKFEVRDCCGVVVEINPESEPVGREGVAKYYFAADGARAEMKLTVWRE